LILAGTPSPTVCNWRSDAALALAACGRPERATELIAAELALTQRAGAPRARGLALRAAALLGPTSTRSSTLQDAAQLLRQAGSPVELARTLTDHGVAQLRDGARDAGRASLREALDLADRHGADAIAARAHTELIVAGARPRRRRTSGPDALTAAELRVARMAADGRTNREIAGELFVSEKTVEGHLRNVFAKLDVSARAAVAEVVGRSRAETAD
jgi:DNA-binding CsgD family transcriptional regulator